MQQNLEIGYIEEAMAEWLAYTPNIHRMMDDAGSNPYAITWDFSLTAEITKTTHMLSRRPPINSDS